MINDWDQLYEQRPLVPWVPKPPNKNCPFAVRLRQCASGLWPGQPILEVGCGLAGDLLSLWHEFGVVPYGLDSSPTAIARARQRYALAGLWEDFLYEGDAHAMPFADGMFPLVFGKTSLEHFDNTTTAIREIARVTTPGGYVVFDVPNRRNGYWTESSERTHGHTHLTRLFTIETLVDLFTESGFTVAETWGYHLFYTTPFILWQDVIRRLRPTAATTQAHSRMVQRSVPAIARWVDHLFKMGQDRINRYADCSGWVNDHNGILIGVLAQRGDR